MSKLKPCPFCGGEAKWCSAVDPEDVHACHFIVCVGTCGTQFDACASATEVATVEELCYIAKQTFNLRVPL